MEGGEHEGRDHPGEPGAVTLAQVVIEQSAENVLLQQWRNDHGTDDHDRHLQGAGVTHLFDRGVRGRWHDLVPAGAGDELSKARGQQQVQEQQRQETGSHTFQAWLHPLRAVVKPFHETALQCRLRIQIIAFLS